MALIYHTSVFLCPDLCTLCRDCLLCQKSWNEPSGSRQNRPLCCALALLIGGAAAPPSAIRRGCAAPYLCYDFARSLYLCGDTLLCANLFQTTITERLSPWRDFVTHRARSSSHRRCALGTCHTNTLTRPLAPQGQATKKPFPFNFVSAPPHSVPELFRLYDIFLWKISTTSCRSALALPHPSAAARRKSKGLEK